MGRIVLAVTVLCQDHRDLAGRPLLSEDDGLVVLAGHAQAEREIVDGEELRDETMIVRRNCKPLPRTGSYFAAYGVRPFFAARTANEPPA